MTTPPGTNLHGSNTCSTVEKAGRRGRSTGPKLSEAAVTNQRQKPPRPVAVTVPDWYAKGLAVLERYLRRAEAMTGPVVYPDMDEAVILCQRLVGLVDPEVVQDVTAASRRSTER
jgi:hypothetical protein